ncbi:hypothetical protein LBBP_02412 [Leptospira borgpetersenii serovar Ballum]|uniref:Uncharacterized protein n=2 Tax=Leptospira borgpetersenii TaxID=174 RepID=A0A0S2ISM6_LEPBO|nr:hypothetical protein LBBP_02412 [Leptospira borgpetersenii serovar Ballum]
MKTHSLYFGGKATAMRKGMESTFMDCGAQKKSALRARPFRSNSNPGTRLNGADLTILSQMNTGA